jgi:hypothetical protein
VDNIEDKYKDIPKVLKDMQIWLCYDDRFKDRYKGLSDAELKKLYKAPRNPYTDNKASYTNSKLYTFNECLESVKNGISSGIGMVITKNSGLIVIDYDNVLVSYKTDDKLGINIPIFKSDVRDRLNRDINLLNSYVEVSPSGKGIHIYLLANYDIYVNTKQIEIYDRHFIRVSGNSLDNYYEFLDKTKELSELISMYQLDQIKDTTIKTDIYNKKNSHYLELLDNKFTKNHIRYKNKYTDAEILETMFSSNKGTMLRALYYNNLSDDEFYNYKINSIYYKRHKADKYKVQDIDTSNSGKAFTLILYLLHYTYGDIKAVKRLFKNSQLCRADYLKLSYNNGKSDKIDNQFLPKAITYYNNYSKELFK